MVWIFKTYQELTNKERIEIYQLRKEIFCCGGEKDIGFDPMDEVDVTCYHSFCLNDEEIICYCRIIKETDELFKIARVLVSPHHRKKGYAQQLINFTCDKIKENLNGKQVILSALEDIHTLYLKIGFSKTGSFCDFNGIPAIDMFKFI